MHSAISSHTAITQNTITWPFVVALVVHGLLILGVGFNIDLPEIKATPTLDITLVQTHSEISPNNPDFLAQANQQGSGTSEQKNLPRSPLASIKNNTQPGEAPFTAEESSPQETHTIQPHILTTKAETFDPIKQDPEDKQQNTQTVNEVDTEETREIAQLLAEMDEDEEHYAKRPRIHFIDSISAKSSIEAAYIDEWVKKIERIGNVNFPKEAIQRNLNGKLILNATLDHSGNVIDVKIDVSSGYRVLDNAALRIVQLASPYPPLPEPIRKKWDQLNITRTWIFHGKGSLATQ